MIDYRQMLAADIEAGLMLCRKAGWNQLKMDWQLFLNTSPDGCWVALHENKVVGTVATIIYQQHFSWIGMMLIHPEFRHHGIGTQLLTHSLHGLRQQPIVKLDATPAGRELYLKLNFKNECSVSRMTRTAMATYDDFTAVAPIDQDQLAAINKFDRSIFGADRSFLIEWLWKAAPEFAFVLIEENQIKGYCLGRHGYTFTHIGPLVATDINTAKKLLARSLTKMAGYPVIIDVPHADEEWMGWLISLGFAEQRTFTRMYRGDNQVAGIYEKQFAIAGPEFG